MGETLRSQSQAKLRNAACEEAVYPLLEASLACSMLISPVEGHDILSSCMTALWISGLSRCHITDLVHEFPPKMWCLCMNPFRLCLHLANLCSPSQGFLATPFRGKISVDTTLLC